MAKPPPSMPSTSSTARCGEPKSAVENDRVWMTCTCGARIVQALEPVDGHRQRIFTSRGLGDPVAGWRLGLSRLPLGIPELKAVGVEAQRFLMAWVRANLNHHLVRSDDLPAGVACRTVARTSPHCQGAVDRQTSVLELLPDQDTDRFGVYGRGLEGRSIARG